MYPYSYPGIFTRSLSLLKSIKWGTILDGTSKTLGVINQAVPVIYQVKPIIGNAKTLFKINSIINEENTTNNSSINSNSNVNSSPIFYI